MNDQKSIFFLFNADVLEESMARLKIGDSNEMPVQIEP